MRGKLEMEDHTNLAIMRSGILAGFVYEGMEFSQKFIGVKKSN